MEMLGVNLFGSSLAVHQQVATCTATSQIAGTRLYTALVESIFDASGNNQSRSQSASSGVAKVAKII